MEIDTDSGCFCLEVTLQFLIVVGVAGTCGFSVGQTSISVDSDFGLGLEFGFWKLLSFVGGCLTWSL